MSHKISKELFEAVMNIKPRGNTFRIESKGMYYAKNYYTYNDFFFMCKEWAFSKGYMQMLSGIRDNKIGYCFSDRFNHHYYYEAPTEQQAVFMACEQILKMLKEQ